MPRVGFESTIPVFERAKTVHALDREATVSGICIYRVIDLISQIVLFSAYSLFSIEVKYIHTHTHPPISKQSGYSHTLN
jgi:hypothetical protein